MQSSTFSKMKKIIIVFLVLIIAGQSVCFADFTQDQRYKILGYAEYAATNWRTAYTTTDIAALESGYAGKEVPGTYKTDNIDYQGTYRWLCCATWISVILNECCNVGITGNLHHTSTYATQTYTHPYFKEISQDELECGDLVLWDLDSSGEYGHIGMYLGNGKVTDCSSRNNLSDKKPCGGVYVRGMWYDGLGKCLRYTGETTMGPLTPGGSLDSAINALENFFYEKIPFREVSESSIKDIKNETLQYQGLAKQESQTQTETTKDSMETNIIDSVFSKLSDTLSWIINWMFTVAKGMIVGFATAVQMSTGNAIDAATGEDVSGRFANGMMAYLQNDLRKDLENSVTMEKMVYNLVPLYDVNIFNGNKAAGETVSNGSLVMLIRNLVSTLYLAIRKIAIIGLLLTLIILGVKLAIASTGEQKAEYKKKLVSWLMAFVIVFGMHYFLIAIIQINEILVDLLRTIGTNIATSISGGEYVDLSLAMRDLTYQSDMSKSAVATIMYLVMVWYLLKFRLIYFKRLFVTVILIILGPFIGIKYAIDKIRFNKSSSLATWGKEFIFTVGTQTIHALIYTIFVGMTYKMILLSDTAQIAVCILACLFFRFMTTAEKLLRDTLRLVGKQSDSIMGDLDSTNIRELFGSALLARAAIFYKKDYLPNFVLERTRKLYNSGKTAIHEHMQNEYIKLRRDEYIQEYHDSYLPNQSGEMAKVTSELDKKIDDILKQEFDYKMKYFFDSIETGKKFGAGLLKIPIGLTITAAGVGDKETVAIGTMKLFSGIKTVGLTLGAPILGYRSMSEISKLRAQNGTYIDLQKWMAINGTMQVSEKIKKEYVNRKDETIAGNNIKIAVLNQVRKEELMLEQDIANQKEKALKGVEPNATDLEKKLAQKRAKELKESVRQAMKTVDRKDIKEQVKDYMQKTGKYSLTLNDFRNIAERFDVKVSGEIINEKLETEAVIENIKADTIARFIREVTINEGIAKEISLDPTALEQVEENVKEKLEHSNEEEKEGLELALKCLEDKKKEIQGKIKTNVFNNLTKEQQQQVYEALLDATDNEVIEKQVQRLTSDEIVETMKKAVNMEGSIKKRKVRKEFVPVIERVERIRELDELARETGQKPIYKDVGKLVEDMIKNSRITNNPKNN